MNCKECKKEITEVAYCSCCHLASSKTMATLISETMIMVGAPHLKGSWVHPVVIKAQIAAIHKYLEDLKQTKVKG